MRYYRYGDRATADRRARGKVGEAIACHYLVKREYQIIEKNYSSRYGEVDIIAIHAIRILFIEVKCWVRFGQQDLEYALGYRKQQRILRTAVEYMSIHEQYRSMAVGFDVLFINPATWACAHIMNAFGEHK